MSRNDGNVNRGRIGYGIGWANFRGIPLTKVNPAKTVYISNNESNSILNVFGLLNHDETITLFELLILNLLFNNFGYNAP